MRSPILYTDFPRTPPNSFPTFSLTYFCPLVYPVTRLSGDQLSGLAYSALSAPGLDFLPASELLSRSFTCLLSSYAGLELRCSYFLLSLICLKFCVGFWFFLGGESVEIPSFHFKTIILLQTLLQNTLIFFFPLLPNLKVRV